MADLLIHSMTEFSDIIRGALTIAGAANIVEIGAEFGGTSQLLADHAAAAAGRMTSIDPAPKQAFLDWVAENPAVEHVARPSLAAFEDLADVDAWVIDGDHNWFTVYHELQSIRAASRRDGKPMLALLHDVAWPCGRRDAYYAPEQIPPAYRHAYDYAGGANLGDDHLTPDRGFRGLGQFAFALHEGGPRNGVLTAVEDFLDGWKQLGEPIAYAHVPAVFGLGLVFDADAPWAEAMTQHILPWHQNALLARLEENRLRNYLAVIDWQDRAAA